MTLALALACSNGIVVTSDSQVTAGEVRRQSHKISPVGRSALWTASGTVGFIQKVEEQLASLPEEQRRGLKQLHQPLLEVVRTLRTESLNQWKRMHSVYDVDEACRRAPGCEILLADFVDGRPRIVHINFNCEDEWLEEFGFGAIGIGMPFAHALLEGYDTRKLDTRRTSLLAYRVLKHAIAVGSFGLGEPIDVWVIEQVKKGSQARRLEGADFQAIEDAYRIWLTIERELFASLPIQLYDLTKKELVS